MPKRIHKRWLEVIFLKSPQAAGSEGLQYRLIPLETDLAADIAAPPPYSCSVKWSQLNRSYRELHQCVERLMDAAKRGDVRDAIDLESVIDSCAAVVLPPMGLASLLQPFSGINPWLVITQPDVANLPWEVFPESFCYCLNPECAQHRRPQPHHADPGGAAGFCTTCGRELRQISRRTVFRQHVAHFVHSNEVIPPPQGKGFLIVADPTENLLDAEHDPAGVCRKHIAEIRNLLQNAGYDVELLRGKQATDIAVLDALASPQLVGVYYFGHGYLEKGGGEEGCLKLHGGTSLDASDIEAARPRCRFVYLNACHGAAVGQDWGFDKPLRSMAHAFAAGGPGRVVIAPIWPVISGHAAAMAVDFFRQAVRRWSLSRALRSARLRSYRRYLGKASIGEQPKPDYCWAAYRYFGDPDRALPAPEETTESTTVASERVFDAEGQLNDDLFAFSIDDVLLRAAKRRNLQGRRQVTCSDFLAGMIRCGELTRTLLRKNGIAPDDLYEKLQDTVEREAGAGDDLSNATENLRKALAELDKWVIRGQDEFEPEMRSILCAADHAAQQGEEPHLISETDVLNAYLSRPCWDENPYVELPKAEKIRLLIQDESWREHVDANGCMVFSDLEPSAKKIIDRAHAMAQWRGTCPIPSRVMLVAFLFDKNGHAAQLCESHEVHRDSLCAVLLAVTGGETPETFQLGDHACSRIVTPMTERARQLAGDSESVDERHLFQAFCEVAPQSFKQLLNALPKPWQLDLDALFCSSEAESKRLSHGPPAMTAPNQELVDVESPRSTAQGVPMAGNAESVTVSSEQFEPAAWGVVLLAANWARLQRSPQLRSPHLFAALVGDGMGPVGTMLRQAKIDPELGKILILTMIPLPNQPSAEDAKVSIGHNASDVLVRAIRLAEKHGRTKANVDDLIEGFFADGGGSVGEQLRQLGVNTKPWWAGNGDGGHSGNGSHHGGNGRGRKGNGRLDRFS